MSSSRAVQVKSAITRRTKRGGRNATSCLMLEKTQHPRHRFREAQPRVVLGLGGRSTLARQRVELRLAVVLGGTPFGLDKSLLFQPIQRRIQRPFLNPEHIVRELMEPRGDAVPVVRGGGEALQDEQVERALQEVDLSYCHVFPRRSGGGNSLLPSLDGPRKRVVYRFGHPAGGTQGPLLGPTSSGRPAGSTLSVRART